MSTFNRVWNPKYWRVESEEKNKLIENDIVYKMKVGEHIEFPGFCDLIEYISKNNYENIINEKYRIEVNIYQEHSIKLFNEANVEIPLVNNHELKNSKTINQNKILIKKIDRKRIKPVM